MKITALNAKRILQILFDRIDRRTIVTGENDQDQQTGDQYAKAEANAADIGKYLISISDHKGVDQRQGRDKGSGAGQEKVHGALPAHHLYDILPFRSDLE